MTEPGIKAPEKPEEGQVCNGCGNCCANELCVFAVMVVGDRPGPCPFMLFRDNRFWCKLVLAEKNNNLEPILEQSLGIGMGCFTGEED